MRPRTKSRGLRVDRERAVYVDHADTLKGIAMEAQEHESPSVSVHVPIGAIYGVIKREGQEKGHWTRIGTAFVNRDGSINLRFDLFVTDPKMTIQVRWKENEED